MTASPSYLGLQALLVTVRGWGNPHKRQDKGLRRFPEKIIPTHRFRLLSFLRRQESIPRRRTGFPPAQE